MGVATVAETVSVSGAAPVVDVTSTTNQTLLTREQLELTPTSRNSLMSILALAPGVRTRIDVGGDQMLEDPDARVFGQAGEMWTTVEGIGIASLDIESGSGVFFDFNTVEETRVGDGQHRHHAIVIRFAAQIGNLGFVRLQVERFAVGGDPLRLEQVFPGGDLGLGVDDELLARLDLPRAASQLFLHLVQRQVKAM